MFFRKIAKITLSHGTSLTTIVILANWIIYWNAEIIQFLRKMWGFKLRKSHNISFSKKISDGSTVLPKKHFFFNSYWNKKRSRVLIRDEFIKTEVIFSKKNVLNISTSRWCNGLVKIPQLTEKFYSLVNFWDYCS